MGSKRCKECNEAKLVSEFHKQKGSKDGFKGVCKKCRKEKIDNYYRTFNGVLSKIYNHQKEASIRRNHTSPNYTK